jgi:inner membrane protein
VALAAAIVLSAAFLGVQARASGAARAAVAAELQRRDPASSMIDAAMTAAPANPLCWSFASVERNDAAGTYRLRRGTLRLAAGAHCPAAFGIAAGDGVNIEWEHEASLAQLRTLRRDSCQFDAWLRFARAPLVEGDVANDARYGTATQRSFATMEHFTDKPCPGGVPQWGYPRGDLLGSAK